MADTSVGFTSPNLLDFLINKIEELSTNQLKVINIMVENEIYRRRAMYALRIARQKPLATMPHLADRVNTVESILQLKNPTANSRAMDAVEVLELFLDIDEDAFKEAEAA